MANQKPTKSFLLRLPESLHWKAKVRAASERRTLQAVLVALLRQYVDDGLPTEKEKSS